MLKNAPLKTPGGKNHCLQGNRWQWAYMHFLQQNMLLMKTIEYIENDTSLCDCNLKLGWEIMKKVETSPSGIVRLKDLLCL